MSASHCSIFTRSRLAGTLLLVAAALLISSLPSSVLAARIATVNITRFIQGQDPDPAQVVDAIDRPDTIGAGDYYARVLIGTQQPFVRYRIDFRESSDFRPNWRLSRELDETGTIPIENNDGIIDLNPSDNSQDLVLNLDLATCRWTGDAISPSSGDGDSEHFGALEGGELHFKLGTTNGIGAAVA